MRRFAFVFATATIAALVSNEARAQVVNAQPAGAGLRGCYQIVSERGWQRIALKSQAENIISVTRGDGWSVDAKNYAAVGRQGHKGRAAEALAPYSGYKYDKRYPFGALLVRGPSRKVIHMKFKSFSLPAGSAKSIEFRINDRNDALGDNAGALLLCVEPT